MNTNVQTVGMAMVAQTAIRYIGRIGFAWLVLKFIDRWVMTYLANL